MATPPQDTKSFLNVDGDTAAAMASYPFIDAAFLYPITPATLMCEMVDDMSAKGKKNIFGNVVVTKELQAEGGVAGALHGAAAAGSLTATYTCSQGLLLMVPNMYKIAYEMLPTVFHVASRLVAHHAMSLYCDYSDITACLPTGFTFLCSSNPQECLDLGTMAHVLTCKSSIPVLHFFDGLRTSHEYQKIAPVPESVCKAMFPAEEVREWRARYAMNPEHPTMRGCGQNTDVFWSLSERTAPFFRAVPDKCQAVMDRFAELTGRRYHIVEYYGHPEAEHVVVLMGSGASSARETIEWMAEHENAKVGVVQIRLYRPFPSAALLAAIPRTCTRLTVLDRVKQVTAAAEPLFLEVLASVYNSPRRAEIDVIGGKFGIGGWEFNPCHVRAVLANMAAKDPMRRFCIGIEDDVSHTSLPVVLPNTPEALVHPLPPSPLPAGTVQALFYGRGSDGTVGSCKTAISLIGSNTNLYTQGYITYDAKKTGGFTFCHLRFGPHPILSEYEIYESDYTACHHPTYVHAFDVGRTMKPGSIFVLNSSWETMEELEHHLPATLKHQIAERHIRFYNINAARLAQELKLGGHINMIMQACFFSLSGVLPVEHALALLKESIVKLYSKKGDALVQANIAVIDRTLVHLKPVEYNQAAWASCPIPAPHMHGDAFLDDVVEPILHQRAQFQSVSKFPESVARGVFPTHTTRFEKRGIAPAVPAWNATKCVQCNICASICPHATIRPFIIDRNTDAAAPVPMETKKLNGIKPDVAEGHDYQFRIQVSPMDCQGCGLCVAECPAKALQMRPFEDPKTDEEAKAWDYCMTLPEGRGAELFPATENVRDLQFRQPMLEFHAACAGCSEPTYMKMITQLLGAQMFLANAVGCSMVWGGFTPTSPHVRNAEGHGPVYGTSLFEDNAEFGYGISVSVRQRREAIRQAALRVLADPSAIAPSLAAALRAWVDVFADTRASKQAGDVVKAELKKLAAAPAPLSPLAALCDNQDMLAAKSVWIVGGDGWAYDIDFHGLDHVLHSDERVTVLVLDTEVYSNTGGQTSKSTPRHMQSKLTAAGKPTRKKEFGLYAMSLNSCYVAQVALGANKQQFIKAVVEAERAPGPALIVCYCPCIAHGLKEGMDQSQAQQRLAVQSGYWPLYRFNPELAKKGQNPLTIDYAAPLSPPEPSAAPAAAAPPKAGQTLHDFLLKELRFAAVLERDPASAARMEADLQADIDQRNRRLRRMMDVYAPVVAAAPAAPAAAAPAPAANATAPAK